MLIINKLLTIFIGINLWLAAFFGNGQTAKDLYESGLQQYEAGNLRQAISIFSTTISLDTTFFPAYCARAWVLFEDGQTDAAFKDVRLVLSKDSSHITANQHISLFLASQKKYPEAIYYASKAVEADSEDHFNWYNRGRIWLEQENYEKALLDIEQARKRMPQNTEYCFYCGFIKSKQGRFYEAISDFSEVITLDSTFADAYSNRGMCFYELDQYGKAIQDFNKSLDYNPEDGETLLNRGGAKAQLGNIDAACEDWKRSFDVGFLEAGDYIRDYCTQDTTLQPDFTLNNTPIKYGMHLNMADTALLLCKATGLKPHSDVFYVVKNSQNQVIKQVTAAKDAPKAQADTSVLIDLSFIKPNKRATIKVIFLNYAGENSVMEWKLNLK